MTLYHDSRSEEYRSPMGATPCAGKVRLRVRADQVRSVTLRIWWNDAEYRWYMRRVENGLYEYEMSVPEQPGLLWYYFIAEDRDGNTWYLGNADDGMGGVGSVTRSEPPAFQVTVYDP
ncbi:MAG: glycoside hydrolase family 13 protein, partial [Aristaeellaceae bacterium]